MEERKQFLKEAKLKATNYCAYRERTQQEVRDKLYALGLHRDEVEDLLTDLITENFINEERFAVSFAGGKFRMKKWGRLKIIMELKRRNISDYCLKKALEEISDEDYQETILQLAEKKIQSLRDKDMFIKKQKTARYLAGKGFEKELVWRVLEAMKA